METPSSFWLQEQVQTPSPSWIFCCNIIKNHRPSSFILMTAHGTHVYTAKLWTDHALSSCTASPALFLCNILRFPEEILYTGWKQLFPITVQVNLLFKWNVHCCFSSTFTRSCLTLCMTMLTNSDFTCKLHIIKGSTSVLKSDVKMPDHTLAKQHSHYYKWEKFSFLFFSCYLFKGSLLFENWVYRKFLKK